jgi:hypothetical protein
VHYARVDKLTTSRLANSLGKIEVLANDDDDDDDDDDESGRGDDIHNGIPFCPGSCAALVELEWIRMANLDPGGNMVPRCQVRAKFKISVGC